MSKTINAAQLLALLRNGQVTVNFTKLDGSERVMKCTLQAAYLPERRASTEALVKESNNSIIAVWDLEENAWRAFKINSVTSVSIAGFQYSPAKSMLLG